MKSPDVLADAFGRVRDAVYRAVGGIAPEHLVARLDEEASSIAWLVWHIARIQDDHVADLAGTEQVWNAGGWRERFGLPLPAGDTGYGHSAADVASVRVSSGTLLTGYLDAVHERTLSYLRQLDEDDLTRVVDKSWDPPVTLGVRLVSVLSDNLQHAGQAGLVRGVLERRHR